MFGSRRAVFGLHKAVFGLHKAVFGLHKAVFGLHKALCACTRLVGGVLAQGVWEGPVEEDTLVGFSTI